MTIANYLASLDAATNITLNMNFSSRTNSMDVQRAIEDSTEKRTKVRATALTGSSADVDTDMSKHQRLQLPLKASPGQLHNSTAMQAKLHTGALTFTALF